MFIDQFADNLKKNYYERKVLKEIEKEAYQKEKCIVDANKINQIRIDAEQKGIDKAHKSSGGLGAMLDRAAKRMKGPKQKSEVKEMPSMIKFG